MKKNDLILIIVFIAFLIVPNFAYWILKDKVDNTNYENRPLFNKPSFEYNQILDYPTNFNNYYNDNIPFKNEIRKIRAKAYYNFINISSNNSVIIGKNNWLFYSNFGDGDPIGDYRNTKTVTNTFFENTLKSVSKNQTLLKNRKTKFYLFIAPNKENIYSENMPQLITINNDGINLVDEIIKSAENYSNIKIIYPKNELIDAKVNYDTYFKYDTHWNSYGAYIGVKKLMEVIDKKFKMPKPTVNYIDYTGDLLRMSLLNFPPNSEPDVHIFDNIKVSCSNETVQVCTSNAKKKDTLMVVGDSFRVAMVPFLSKIYNKTIFVHRDSYTDDLLNKYEPDIVISEYVERYATLIQYQSLIK